MNPDFVDLLHALSEAGAEGRIDLFATDANSGGIAFVKTWTESSRSWGVYEAIAVVIALGAVPFAVAVVKLGGWPWRRLRTTHVSKDGG